VTPLQVTECLNKATNRRSILGKLADALRAVSQTPGRPSSRLPFQELGKLVDRLHELNGKLAKRPTTVQVFFTSKKPVRLFLGPLSTNLEMRIVFEIINASDGGILDRVKACVYCQQFFVARRDADRFCPGDSCRKNWHRKTPEGKKYNAEYQREYRRQEQDRSVRALQNHKAKKGHL
jgi:hypothetical protein